MSTDIANKVIVGTLITLMGASGAFLVDLITIKEKVRTREDVDNHILLKIDQIEEKINQILIHIIKERP